MRDLVEKCETGAREDEKPAMFEEALSLMLEIRVPRMPDTEKELSRMLREAENGPTLTTEEVWANLDVHARRFQTWLCQYRHMIERRSWQEAANALAPSKTPGAPKWHGKQCRLLTSDGGEAEAAIIRGDNKIEETAPEPELAVLGAVLRAHTEWYDIWRR